MNYVKCVCLMIMQESDVASAPSSPSQQSRELKTVYREQYTELQAVKAEADYTQKLVEQCMHELVLDFQSWSVNMLHPCTQA